MPKTTGTLCLPHHLHGAGKSTTPESGKPCPSCGNSGPGHAGEASGSWGQRIDYHPVNKNSLMLEQTEFAVLEVTGITQTQPIARGRTPCLRISDALPRFAPSSRPNFRSLPNTAPTPCDVRNAAGRVLISYCRRTAGLARRTVSLGLPTCDIGTDQSTGR